MAEAALELGDPAERVEPQNILFAAEGAEHAVRSPVEAIDEHELERALRASQLHDRAILRRVLAETKGSRLFY